MLTTILDDVPTWLAVAIAVVTYACVGTAVLVAAGFAALSIEQRVNRRRAVGPETASLQERRAAADLGYSRGVGR